ncbi:hypothetical protein MIT9_P1469 [Methylomarinovum caldicuralii]|uniref:DNA replication terminus site-binding protein n=1 Tax=Methylomarinovum caldicuralii TaxID=438856 RepID=A0AAU9C0P8_9GAMM|nr:DNA replication terminus site-binding protein [Methylomarinovum caldicuralii]BCX81887.1 hypothetical protein MIT9_P1469 [Methylomarinovum caldicuralii]
MNLNQAEENLIHRFQALREAIQDFVVQLNQESRRAWVFDLAHREYHDAEARSQLIQILTRLEYPDNRDGRETDPCPGIIGAGPRTLALAGALNQARDAFKQAVLAINSHDRERSRRLMAAQGFARLHFKQLYRHQPILLRKPCSIRFTWGATRSIKRISRQEAYRRLTALAGDDPSPGYLRQLELLAQHPKDEPIAIVQDLKPHIKANVCWIQGSGQDRQVIRKMISAPLAILIPLDPGEDLPQHSAAYPEARKPRKPRADTRIERELFLPSIRGHRYCR